MEIILTTNLKKQLEFDIFKVASYHEERERVYYILDVLEDHTLMIVPYRRLLIRFLWKVYQNARSLKIYDKKRKKKSRFWPRIEIKMKQARDDI